MNESAGGAYDWSSFWEGDNCTWSASAACTPENGSAAHNASGALNASDAAPRDPLLAAATSVLLALLILATIVGNVFVIAAILLERHLQTVGNYLVASLAVADLMVACLVMPLGAVYEISQGWILGPELCDMWTASDVLCCTASILHLVAIATDRYWAVTNVDYARSRTQRRIVGMIVLVWTAALVVSLAPQLGWKDPAYLDRITRQRRCLVSQDLSYQIFATCSTFYVPLAVILALYWRIYQAARSRIRRRRDVPKPSAAPVVAPRSARDRRFIKKRFLNLRKCKQREKATAALLLTEGQSTTTVDEISTTAFTVCERVPSVTSAPAASPAPVAAPPPAPPAATPAAPSAPPPRDKKESLEAKRERKAAKTLAIITGAFVFCWLPFFIMALVMPLCPSCRIDDSLASFFLWLGYFNSALNPVIYTIFSPDFRRAFTRILLGAHRRRRPTKPF